VIAYKAKAIWKNYKTASVNFLMQEEHTLAAGKAEAYRSAARNEQPCRGSVISLMPATTAYALPSLKLPDKKIISLLSKIGTSSSAYRFIPLAMRFRLNNTVFIYSIV